MRVKSSAYWLGIDLKRVGLQRSLTKMLKRIYESLEPCAIPRLHLTHFERQALSDELVVSININQGALIQDLSARKFKEVKNDG